MTKAKSDDKSRKPRPKNKFKIAAQEAELLAITKKYDYLMWTIDRDGKTVPTPLQKLLHRQAALLQSGQKLDIVIIDRKKK